MNKIPKITSYNQIDSISLFIKTSNGIQEVALEGNTGLTLFRNIFNNLEAKYNVESAPKKIVIDDFSERRTVPTKKTVKKVQPKVEEIEAEMIEGYDGDEIYETEDISLPNPNDFTKGKAPQSGEINLNRSNVMNLNYSIPTSGEMTPAQAAKLMASQSGFSFQR